MARQRRGGGFRSPELRGTLGTLLRTTLAQAGSLRDVLERGAREGRTRLDDALSTRRRKDDLAELGEIVLDPIRRGEIDLGELPEAHDIVARLDEVDASHADDHDEPPAVPPARNRAGARRKPGAEDGTVSSKAWQPPNRAKPQRVWRPPAVSAPEESDTDPGATPEPPASQVTARKPRARPSPARKGGISFDDDDDLAEYMHPDDVPPKGSPEGDS